MEVKYLEIRDAATFIPVICIRPVPENNEQAYLLRRDGFRGNETERLIIVIRPHRGAHYCPYDWDNSTMVAAHRAIENDWWALKDGDVVDVEFIQGITDTKKVSERFTNPF